MRREFINFFLLPLNAFQLTEKFNLSSLLSNIDIIFMNLEG